ncbi:MAG: sigma-70 family RNA polymerase sigma factor [Lapillicoccus sp.]
MTTPGLAPHDRADPEHGLQHALGGADLTGQGAPTPPGSPSGSSHSTAGSQPAQSQGAARALAQTTLVTRAQDGDVAAFERLARSYEAELVRLGYRMLSDLGEAQDAVQDTLLVAWRKLPTVRDPAAFHAWIYQLMTRRCLNLLRQRARRRTTSAVDEDLDRAQQARATPTPTGEEPAALAQVQAMRDGLTLALTALPAEQRACWVLHNLHHLSYPEIAYAIGVPVSTVRGRIARARAQLAKGMSSWQ